MDNTRVNQILRRPVITEKMTILKDKKKRNGEILNQYAFEVSKDANKMEIKQAIEKKFNVKVDSVRTINVMGKAKIRWTKAGRTEGKSRDWKKAVVTLAKDNKIEFVEGAA
ncbi:50S ribosomal protein L23 [bacterium]|nr:50S ribosomal protein L23 [bacterium]NUM81002.1 50S ribosomal protein L23 [bacterium]